MRVTECSGGELVGALLAPGEPSVADTLAVVTSPPPSLGPLDRRRVLERLSNLPSVVVASPGLDTSQPGVLDLIDVEASAPEELTSIAGTVADVPIAAATAAVLLRGSESRSSTTGFQLESAVYAALQAGPEHAAWLTDRARVARRPDPTPRVRAERDGGVLRITIQRPSTRNALDLRMRDELLELLAVAEADPDLSVRLAGDGPSFCSGGDLGEFGTAPDPATAHLVRLRRSVGATLDRLADRLSVSVHGRCAGSGVELPAFAGRVVARVDTTFELPELRMGLIPGAGGSVSLPRRIGRHRTAWLLLTGRRIDATTARSWGLVDHIDLI